MKIYTAQSKKMIPKDAVNELKEIFNSQNKTVGDIGASANSENAKNIKAITFFASSIYEPSDLIAAMNENFPNIQVFGCSTMGELITGELHSNSIVAMAFTDEIIEDIKIEVLENTTKKIDLESAVHSFEEYYSTPISQLDNKKYFGIAYFDGIAQKEEIILDRLGEYTNVFFTGGSAGDDVKFQKTFVYAKGKCYSEAAVLAIVKSKVKFGFEKMQSVVSTGHKVIATKVDEANRLVYEFDGRPVGEVYMELLGIPLDEVPNTFAEYVFAHNIDGQPYLRALQHCGEQLEFRTACAIKKGTEIEIMKLGDIVGDTRKSLNEIKKKYTNILGALAFDCGYRYFTALAKNAVVEYGNLFSEYPTVGFCTYGEVYLGHLRY
jgi:hypothetical protein